MRHRPAAAPRPTVRPAADGTPCAQPGCAARSSTATATSAAPRPTRRRSSESSSGPLNEVSVATSASKVQSTAFGSARATNATSSTRRTRTGSQRMRAARLGAGLTRVPPAPPVDAAKAINPNPSVPEDKRTCSKCGTEIGRSRDGQAGAPGGVLPAVRAGVLVHAEAEERRRRRRPVRGGRRPRARRPRLDLPRPRPQRLQPVGGAQGPAQLWRPRRAGGGDRRAAVPGAGRAPADRRDLQLRDPRGCRLHRHGVRRRQVAEADPQAADARQQRRRTTRCRSTRRSPTSSRCCRRSSTSTTSAWSTATSSRTT